MENNSAIIKERILQSIETKQAIINNDALICVIEDTAKAITDAIRNGGKVLVCGNGGSASDALHMVGEIVGRFQKERSSWPAIALNADVATMTAIANDYGYDCVFARATEAYMQPKDVLLGISTSGNSENVYRAVLQAKKNGGKTAALLGRDGGKIAKEVDYPLVVPGKVTARIQESHIMIIHILCELVENELAGE